jgi:hypothetical protein
MKKTVIAPKSKKRIRQRFPRGWNEKRVKEVIDYYDKQTEDEELAEYEAAMKLKGQALMLVPAELVGEIRRLIDRRQGQKKNGKPHHRPGAASPRIPSRR